MSDTLRVLTFVAALGAGAVSGVFFAFSGFVMAGLARLPVAHGIAAMQSINVTAVRPPLMGLLFGTAAVCVAVGVVGGLSWGDPGASLTLAGAAIYLVGTIGVTAVCNVPLNNALVGVDPEDAGGERAWTDYVRRWTRWNSVRTAASALAAAALLLALGS